MARLTADWMGDELETSRSSMEQGLGTELENVFPDDGGEQTCQARDAGAGLFGMVGRRRGSGEDYNLEAFVSAETTLADHLAEQMALAITDPAGRMIGQYLIDMVDEAGYLTGDVDAVADKLGARRSDVELCSRFCRPSIRRAYARAISPNAWRSSSRNAIATIRRCGRWSNISTCWPSAIFPPCARLCGVDDEDLADMIAEIRNLNPKPGLAFGSTMVQPIVPDVFVRAAPDGTWQVELNSDTLPKVLINQRYYAQVSKTSRNDKDKAYIADCMQTATWLVRALDQRAKTILKVSSEIVRQQDGFFAKGVQHLRPLNLKTVADAIGMHEFDRVARHREQIHGDEPRHFRIEILLYVGHRGCRRRRSAFRRSSSSPHPSADRR